MAAGNWPDTADAIVAEAWASVAAPWCLLAAGGVGCSVRVPLFEVVAGMLAWLELEDEDDGMLMRGWLKAAVVVAELAWTVLEDEDDEAMADVLGDLVLFLLVSGIRWVSLK